MAKNSSEDQVSENSDQISENYISIGLGLLVVIVIGILLYNYFTQKNQQPVVEETQVEATPSATESAARPGSNYTVVAGDTLWSISEKSYGTGYNWQEIAKANNLTTNDVLEPGKEIYIPEVKAEASTVAAAASPSAVASPAEEVKASPETAVMTPSPSPENTVTNPQPQPTVSGSSYTVVAGDTLWSIAQKAYGDPYKWVTIAQANNLMNPNLIHPGNVFTLPR